MNRLTPGAADAAGGPGSSRSVVAVVDTLSQSRHGMDSWGREAERSAAE